MQFLDQYGPWYMDNKLIVVTLNSYKQKTIKQNGIQREYEFQNTCLLRLAT